MDWREGEGKWEVENPAELSVDRPADLRPNLTLLWSLKCDILNQTNRESDRNTDRLTD